MGTESLYIEREALIRERDEARRELAAKDARISVLESELEQAANALQKAHPIGEVKAIGLREVGLAVEQVCEILAAKDAEIERLRKAIDEAIGYLSFGWTKDCDNELRSALSPQPPNHAVQATAGG